MSYLKDTEVGHVDVVVSVQLALARTPGKLPAGRAHNRNGMFAFSGGTFSRRLPGTIRFGCVIFTWHVFTSTSSTFIRPGGSVNGVN
jgi:hypothetical protein